MRNILIIQTAWLGDNILTLPLVSNAAKIGKVHILTIPQWADVYRNNPDVSSIITYDKHRAERGISGIRRKGFSLRKMNFDVALLAQKWWRSALVAGLANIGVRIGFDDAPAKKFYTHTVEYDRNLHESERLLNLLKPLGVEPEMVAPKLFPTNDDEKQAHKILRRQGWNGEETIAIAPESAWRTKRYPHFVEVVKILANSGFSVMLIGAERETENFFRKNLSVNKHIFFIFGKKLLVVASALKNAGVLISNDSGAGHIGAAVNVPVLSLFGPTVPEQGFFPIGEENRIVQKNLPCRPCSAHGTEKCPLGHHRCMTEIEPEEIAQTAVEMTKN